MIQLNLLPDVKLEYLKANRLKKTITSISVLTTVVSVGILLVMIGVGFAEKARISNVDEDIKTKSGQLKNKPQIDKVLTVQNQLNSLTQLHSDKPAVSNLFTYLNQVTPAQASISNLHVDFAVGAEKMTITGTSDALSSVNKYIDTLKFTKYITESNTTETSAFNNIVLTSFALSNSAGAQGAQPASYTIDLAYDPIIFKITEKVTLKVPQQTTTRSSIDAPSNLFKSNGESQ